MRVSERQIARACVDLSHEGKLDPHEVSRAVFDFLSKKHWMHRSEQVLLEIYRAINSDQGIIPVTITSIRALSDSEKKEIERVVTQFFPEQKILCTWKEDVNLVGGIIIETENVRYDISLRSALHKLSHSYSL